MANIASSPGLLLSEAYNQSDSESEGSKRSIAFVGLENNHPYLTAPHAGSPVDTALTDGEEQFADSEEDDEEDPEELHGDLTNVGKNGKDVKKDTARNATRGVEKSGKKRMKKRRERWRHKSETVGAMFNKALVSSGDSDKELSANKNLIQRRRIRRARSRSEAVIPTLAMLTSQSGEISPLGSDVQVTNASGVHSDTDIPVLLNGQDEERSRSTKRNSGRFRYLSTFAVGGGSLGDSTHGENSGSNFRRRISQFNPDVLGSGLSRNFRFNTLRMNFGRKKKEAAPEEYVKSAELISELQSGVPAAIILASQFQRDERNLRRVPVLLEQINVKISEIPTSHCNRPRYKIDLEYGSGPARVTWSVSKDYKDFSFLNIRLKASSFQPMTLSYKGTIPRLPRRHTLGGGRQKSTAGTSDHELDDESFRGRALERVFSMTSRDSTRSRSSSPHRLNLQNPNLVTELEDYLKRLFQQFKFRADANKVLQFLELSNMSIRLAPESSFHGKEGQLLIRSSASSQGWRVSHWRPNDFSQMIQRHTHKWFLVRHSYILCVENITSTNVLEVFLVDPGFKVTTHAITGEKEEGIHHLAHKSSPQFFLQVENLERKMKMASRSEKTIVAWADSISFMKEHTVWSQQHRFDSFSPVRNNVHAQWFVDARDYFWAVSEAIDMAQDVIYIHDWWLSPELYLRRPPQGNQQWRLDRLLRKKAEQGVKIFIVVYRNVGQTIPIDSQYTKHSLLDLHENIFVMRSPNQWIQNTYFWAHHEKICMVDHTVAFLGGVDLCFGRWDTPDHVLTDDKPKAFYSAADNPPYKPTQIWPGKDYSNPRVQDFHTLDQPFEDMYDRTKVPRMPWHDIHMMVTGHSARDLCRHFVQRWNYLIRQKRTSRYTPFLLPPPDFAAQEIEQFDLAGTCEVQLLRSSGGWSLGLKEPEHSIQNAYLKAIEASEHFVYIENQFFITSTTLDGAMIENKIGDALVERIMRAHRNRELWRAVILIPLMPGFESQVDLPDGSSVRLIMQCQYMSISRGRNSLFSRLHYAGIHPEEYIQFFSLRKWGKIGPNKKLITEQLYIHAKAMVVDDRIAIIGSANINERSMRGNRDSEIAAFIRDTHQIPSKMGGQPYMVGKFAHTLRMRLMREHLGVEVDKIDLIDKNVEMLSKASAETEMNGRVTDSPDDLASVKNDGHDQFELHSFNYLAGKENKGLREKKSLSSDSRVQNNPKHAADILGSGFDAMVDQDRVRAKQDRYERDHRHKLKVPSSDNDESIDDIIDDILSEDSISDLVTFKRRLYDRLVGKGESLQSEVTSRSVSHESGLDNLVMHGPAGFGTVDIDNISTALVDPFCFEDPLDENFYYDIWLRTAQRNTSLFREVFRCQPDDEVTTWKEYKEYVAFGEKFSSMQDIQNDQIPLEGEQARKPHAPLGDVDISLRTFPREEGSKSTLRQDQEQDPGRRDHCKCQSQSPKQDQQRAGSPGEDVLHMLDEDTTTNNDDATKKTESKADAINYPRRRRATTHGAKRFFANSMDHVYNTATATKILENVQGNLVMFPTEWLARELET